jgi:hypothetical protein
VLEEFGNVIASGESAIRLTETPITLIEAPTQKDLSNNQISVAQRQFIGWLKPGGFTDPLFVTLNTIVAVYPDLPESQRVI